MVQLQLRCGYLWCFALLRSHMALPCTNALGVTIRYAGSNIFFYVYRCDGANVGIIISYRCMG